MVRSMLGQGRLITRKPFSPVATGFPLKSTTSAMTPGIGSVADPGLAATAPGMGEIKIAPVSVCHQVSTIGQRFLPITRQYHSQAAGLIGSPTEPKSLRLERSCAS